MAAEPEFEKLDLGDPDQFRNWLETQPTEVSAAIAVRSALRLIPILGPELADENDEMLVAVLQDVFAPIIRALNLAWGGLVFPSQPPAAATTIASVTRSISAAVEISESVVITSDIVKSGHAAFRAFTAAATADRSTAIDASTESVGFAAQAATEQAGWVFSEIIADRLLFAGGMSISDLANSKLWHGEPADSVTRHWADLKDRLHSLGEGWEAWTDWYEGRLRGVRVIEGMQIARATIDEKIWEQRPAAVNQHILDLEAGIGSGSIEIKTAKASEFDKVQPEPSFIEDSESNQTETDALKSDESVEADPGSSAQPQPPAADEGYTDLTFLDDRPDTENDVLGRSNLAFMLAGKLNQVWDALNREPEPSPEIENTYDSSTWAPQAQFDREPELADGAFVVQVDAPWGGGKTTFANYLARFLNPYVHPGPLPKWDAMKELAAEDFSPAHFRRPWHIVQFNAWQHQHISPPWWAFYQMIRKQGFHGIRTDANRVADDALKPPAGSFRPWPARQTEWLWLWWCELWWRLFNPKNQVLLVIVAVALCAALALDYFGFLAIEKAKLTWDIKGVSSIFATGLTVLAGGGAFIWTIVSTLTESLLPGTPSAAKNYSLGAGDPLERFRKHFARTIERLRRPVLVVIDDLDRCKPDFVVELVRGMQTILRSPRVVFLILGDRDWIEQAFAEQHSAMEGIDVGPEHSFGGRFVEKAIQMSFVLPEVGEELRGDYVKALLKVHNVEEVASEAEKPKLDAIVADIGQMSKAPSIDIRDQQVTELKQRLENDVSNDEIKKAVTRQINRTAALQNATDARLHAATQHRIVPLSPILPSNPRQIKRIINAISLYQEIARIEADIQPKGDPRWQQLAQWVVLMTEYPQTWFTLNLYPGLADRFHNPTADTKGDLPEDALAARWLGQMRASEMIPKLMAYSGWQQAGPEIRINSETVALFKPLMPATSGKTLPTSE